MAKRQAPRKSNVPAKTTPPAHHRAGDPSPTDVRKEIEIRTSQWSGPLPPPAVLEGYNHLVQDGAERVFRQFELETTHRRELEAKNLRSAVIESRAGQALAGLFAFAALGVTVFAISEGAYVVAGVIGGTTLVGVVASFLYTKAKEN